MKTAIYPFSGDPITYGHIDIIQRAALIFDHVIAAVGINPLKQYMFSTDERVHMAEVALGHIPNVTVDHYEGLLAEFAGKHHTPVIIRGIRNQEDFSYEWTINQINEAIDGRLETFWMPCKKEKELISSSTVKQRWRDKEDITTMVPAIVIEMLSVKVG